MLYDPKTCTSLCLAKGFSEGNLYVDFEVCPLKYFCDCQCFKVGNNSCETKCNEKGQIVKPTTPTSIGCEICDCQCPKRNCVEICMENEFPMYINNHSCEDCMCLCPDVDCDLYCDNRAGAGVLGPADPMGCSTCGGCRELPQKGMGTFFPNLGRHLNFKQKLNCSKIFFILFWNFLTFRKYLHRGEFSSFWPRNHDRHFNSYGIAFMYHKVSLN